MIVKKVPTVQARRAQEQGRERARPGRLHRRSQRRRRRREGRAPRRPEPPALDHDGQVQEMIDLAETANRSRQARPALDHELAGGRAADVGPGRRGGQDVPGRDGPGRPPGDLWAAPRHRELAPPPRRQPRPPRDGEARHRQQGLRPRGRPPGHRSDRAAPAVAARGAGRCTLRALDGEIKRVQAPREPSASPPPARDGSKSGSARAAPSASPSRRRRPSSAEPGAGGRCTRPSAQTGMRFEKKGSGALLWIGDQPVKASGAGRDCSMSALQKRLGEFEARAHATAAAHRRPPASTARSRLRPWWRTYLEQRRKHYEQRANQDRAREPPSSDEWRQLADRHRQERADIFRGSWKGKGDAPQRPAQPHRRPPGAGEGRPARPPEAGTGCRAPGPGPVSLVRRMARPLRPQRRGQVATPGAAPATIEGATFDPPTPRDIRACRPWWMAIVCTTTCRAPAAHPPSPIAARPSTSTTAADAKRSWPPFS